MSHRIVMIAIWMIMTGSHCLLSGCSSGSYLMPTPAVLVDTALSPLSKISPALQSNKVDVLYATDRTSVGVERGRVPYSAGRSQRLAIGTATVEIGKQVGWQSLVNASTMLRRNLTLPLAVTGVNEIAHFPTTPYPMLANGEKYEETSNALALEREAITALHKELDRRLAMTPRKEIFLYIHGYSNNFDDAVFVISELWHFFGRQGVPVAYSWPAGIGGLLRGYTYDRESGEFTNYHLKQFLRALMSHPGVEKIHILAHSRGTDVCTTALRELFIESRAAGRPLPGACKIGNLVLAAPDMDMEVVTQRVAAERIQLGVERATIYVSPTDRALGISGWLFRGARRLGRVTENDFNEEQKRNLKQFKKVSIIKVSAHSGFIGHSYFHSNPAVSADLVMLMRDNRDPGAENGRPLRELYPGFWELYSGYPNKAQD